MDLVADLLHFSIKDMEDISAANDVLSDPLPDCQRGFTHSQCHDYLNYLEAWKLLGGGP